MYLDGDFQKGLGESLTEGIHAASGDKQVSLGNQRDREGVKQHSKVIRQVPGVSALGSPFLLLMSCMI